MPNLLAAHYIPTHGRPEDVDYISQINPSVVKFVDADAHRVLEVYQRLGPAPWYFLRDWSLSEQKGDMQADPVGTGRRHALERIAAAKNYPVPKERVILSGINEPAVWEDFSCVPYTVSFLNTLAQEGYKGAALNLSVGWPTNNGEGTPPNWAPFEPVKQAIIDGKHFLCLHEYWDERGCGYNWGWWAGRYESCPWDVPIIIGECGIDKYVSDPTVSPDMRGWQGWLNPQQYAQQVSDYMLRCSSDSRIIGLCVYTTDFGHPWSSFDTQPARNELGNLYVEAPEPNWAAPLPVVVDEFPAGGWNVESAVNSTPAARSAVVHPIEGAAPITQHFYDNPENYAQFGMPGHDGVDFAVPTGTPVLAIADGKVAYLGTDAGYGNYVRIWHPEFRCHSFYAHLSNITCTLGVQVKAGMAIGRSGNTGNSTGAHLHLEIRIGEEGAYSQLTPMPQGRIDPETWFAMHGVKL